MLNILWYTVTYFLTSNYVHMYAFNKLFLNFLLPAYSVFYIFMFNFINKILFLTRSFDKEFSKVSTTRITIYNCFCMIPLRCYLYIIYSINPDDDMWLILEYACSYDLQCNFNSIGFITCYVLNSFIGVVIPKRITIAKKYGFCNFLRFEPLYAVVRSHFVFFLFLLSGLLLCVAYSKT